MAMHQKPSRVLPPIKWVVRRRGNMFAAVVYLGDNPREVGEYETKRQARAHARKSAADLRAFAGK